MSLFWLVLLFSIFSLAVPYCLPGDRCWPTIAIWQTLNNSVSGRLAVVYPPLSPCFGKGSLESSSCRSALAAFSDTAWRANQPGAMQYPNWEANASGYGCNNVAVECTASGYPAYYVEAHEVSDVISAVVFAGTYNVRLTIKSSGHEITGRSNAPGSLLLWMHHFANSPPLVQTSFANCPGKAPGPAVTVLAGTNWITVYDVVHRANYHIVAGDCPSVCAAGGWVLAGGHSFSSPAYGLGVDNVLRFQVILANGTEATASPCENIDLFWALAGGGGPFAVILSVTYRLYPITAVTGWELEVEVQGPDPMTAAWNVLDYLMIYFASLVSSSTVAGGYFQIMNTKYSHQFVFNGTGQPVQKLIATLSKWLSANSVDHSVTLNHTNTYPSFTDWKMQRPPYTGGIVAYAASRLVPLSVATDQAQRSAALQAFLQVVGGSTFGFQGNLVAGGAVSRLDRQSLYSSINPVWRDTLFHANVGRAALADVDPETMMQLKDEATALGDILRAAFPGTGAYFGESDYNEPNWQTSYWGAANYARLQSIKKVVDPLNVFTCHHCVEVTDGQLPDGATDEDKEAYLKEKYYHQDLYRLDDVSGMNSSTRQALLQAITTTEVVQLQRLVKAYIVVAMHPNGFHMPLPQADSSSPPFVTINDFGPGVQRCVLTALMVTPSDFQRCNAVPPPLQQNSRYLFLLLADRLDSMGNIVHDLPFHFDVPLQANGFELLIYSHLCSSICSGPVYGFPSGTATRIGDIYPVHLNHTSALTVVLQPVASETSSAAARNTMKLQPNATDSEKEDYLKGKYGHGNLRQVDDISGMDLAARQMMVAAMNTTEVVSFGDMVKAYVMVAEYPLGFSLSMPVGNSTSSPSTISVTDFGPGVTHCILTMQNTSSATLRSARVAPPPIPTGASLFFFLLIDRLNSTGHLLHLTPFSFTTNWAAAGTVAMYSHSCDTNCDGMAQSVAMGSATREKKMYHMHLNHTSAVTGVFAADRSTQSSDGGGSDSAFYGLLALIAIPVLLVLGAAAYKWFGRKADKEYDAAAAKYEAATQPTLFIPQPMPVIYQQPYFKAAPSVIEAATAAPQLSPQQPMPPQVLTYINPLPLTTPIVLPASTPSIPTNKVASPNCIPITAPVQQNPAVQSIPPSSTYVSPILQPSLSPAQLFGQQQITQNGVMPNVQVPTQGIYFSPYMQAAPFPGPPLSPRWSEYPRTTAL